MRILFITTAHNSMSQRLLIELSERGHEVVVCVARNAQDMLAAMACNPELIIAPMLKSAIPETIYTAVPCLIVHPGIKGDRGPSSIDWALMDGADIWGTTVLEAAEEFDAGAIWASHEFAVPRDATKSGLYRGPVTEAAVRGVLEAVGRIESGAYASGAWRPQPLAEAMADARGRLRPAMKLADRSVDFQRDDTQTILTMMRATDSQPGVSASILGVACTLFGACPEPTHRGTPGQVLATRDDAICVATTDGALWISHLKVKTDPPGTQGMAGIKLPARQVLAALLWGVRDDALAIDAPAQQGFREITYTEDKDVGYLAFNFYNGAMSTEQCERLRAAFIQARNRPTKVIALLGGADFWSNGIHLNTIEAALDPAMESWRNINAMNDLVQEIITTMSHIVISGMRGNAGAGGAILALAADRVWARQGIVMNPHYSGMGGLYGSEYWTYLLPRRVGTEMARELTTLRGPLGTERACRIGFLDDSFGTDHTSFEALLRHRATEIANDPDLRRLLSEKQNLRRADEAARPLSDYRHTELERMRVNFFGADPAYHVARRCFVFKGNPPPLPASRARTFVDNRQNVEEIA